MCKSSASVNLHESKTAFNPWEEAIQDAEEMVSEATRKIKDLRSAIRTFKAKRDADEPWPGEKGVLGQDSDL